MPDLSIVCVHRGREDRIEDFVVHYKKRYPDAEIIMARQADNEPFKKGQLYNLAIKESVGKYLALVDIDIRLTSEIPFVKLIEDNKKMVIPYNIIHHVKMRDLDSYFVSSKLVWKNSPGGIQLYSKELYESVNGHSNLYIGHSWEDTEMHDRCGGFDRVPNLVYHIEHSFGNRVFRQMKRNENIYKTRKSRDIMLDGMKQTTCVKLVKSEECTRVYNLDISGVRVKTGFAYNHLLRV